MNEEIIRTGKNNALIGILSHGNEDKSAPIVLFLNAGFLHHVGPFRLWVDLARSLQTIKIPSVRFDFSGIGDSQDYDIERSNTNRAIDNIKSVMDYLEGRFGRRDFILVGLCSGADYAHPAALADTRIRGIVFIDGYGYRTKKYQIYRFYQRISNARRWKNLLLRGFKSNTPIIDDESREFPNPELVQKEIQNFLSEGRRLYYIYTAGVPYYYTYENQFWDMFPELKPQNGLYYNFYPSSDHTFTLVAERIELKNRLMEFISNHKKSN